MWNKSRIVSEHLLIRLCFINQEAPSPFQCNNNYIPTLRFQFTRGSTHLIHLPHTQTHRVIHTAVRMHKYKYYVRAIRNREITNTPLCHDIIVTVMRQT